MKLLTTYNDEILCFISQRPTTHPWNSLFDLHTFMSGLQGNVSALRRDNNTSVVIITLVSYDYILQFEKEVRFVWAKQWSVMTCLYLAVRYFGLFLAMLTALWGGLMYMPETVSYPLLVLMQWSFSAYFCLAEVILIWRLYALYNQSKRLLYVLLGLFLPIVALYIGMDIYLYSRPSVFSVQEIITPNFVYCAGSFHMGPMPAIYGSIPIICFDIFLVVLAAAILVKHMKDRREMRMRPNVYMLMIVRYHIIYFVLNLTSQIFTAILWANLSDLVFGIVVTFNDIAPFIIAPRLIVSIWDRHANDKCVYVSTTFEDCVCWTSPPKFEQYEMGSRAERFQNHDEGKIGAE
ncbi:uncharacterized protein EDB91DRAFT_475120 [Suillus paluster]|uniref:uncharacterized protein n=1 Tax=Suillus paluster TaxID=48578 RepID=UPI001B86DDCC|nr:uncharacterized protein EDB91DRAFT_475120 [Suillus paluster]KAG1719312.1 hypothetical protein EDB91DRAFT_475120 [Suillus paluster]